MTDTTPLWFEVVNAISAIGWIIMWIGIPVALLIRWVVRKVKP